MHACKLCSKKCLSRVCWLVSVPKAKALKLTWEPNAERRNKPDICLNLSVPSFGLCEQLTVSSPSSAEPLMWSGAKILNIYSKPGPQCSVRSHWPTSNKKAFQGVQGEVCVCGRKEGRGATRAHQSLCVCVARRGSQIAQSANWEREEKARAGFSQAGRRRLAVLHPWEAAPSGAAPVWSASSYRVYIWLSEAVPASHYSSAVTNYLRSLWLIAGAQS